MGYGKWQGMQQNGWQIIITKQRILLKIKLIQQVLRHMDSPIELSVVDLFDMK